MKDRDFLSLDDYSNADIEKILGVADEMLPLLKTGSDLCKGSIMSQLFFEASTRTQFSFSSAMHRLGGSVLGFSSTAGTSVSKGESLEDTVRMMSGYSDVMVMRHSLEGSMKLVADAIEIPLINAGEGKAEHPTQTLLDLYTIQKELGSLNVKIGFYGDLKHGRTNHSLIVAASRFGASFYCIAQDELQMPDEYVKKAEANGAVVELTKDVNSVLPQLDVLYVSRLQRERLPLGTDFDALQASYCVDAGTLSRMKKKSLVMHPLPRLSEIAVEVDSDSRAAYFRQAANGVPVRMALLALLLGKV